MTKKTDYILFSIDTFLKLAKALGVSYKLPREVWGNMRFSPRGKKDLYMNIGYTPEYSLPLE